MTPDSVNSCLFLYHMHMAAILIVWKSRLCIDAHSCLNSSIFFDVYFNCISKQVSWNYRSCSRQNSIFHEVIINSQLGQTLVTLLRELKVWSDRHWWENFQVYNITPPLKFALIWMYIYMQFSASILIVYNYVYMHIPGADPGLFNSRVVSATS